MNKTTTPATTLPKNYENNPFFIATKGLELLFKNAQSVGIFLAILAGLSALSGVPSLIFNSQPPAENHQQSANNMQPTNFEDFLSSIPVEAWLIGGVLLLIGILIAITIGIIYLGITDYTASRLARGERATLTEAFKGVIGNFWGYTWVLTIVSVKTFLWTLLLIIPGFIMSYRYSLAGVTYFDKKLKGNSSVKHSAGLTKGVWLTTYASQTLLNLVTFGFIQPLLAAGTNANLYRQFSDVNTLNDTKPKAHILSWLTLIVPLVLFVLFVMLASLLVLAFANYKSTSN